MRFLHRGSREGRHGYHERMRRLEAGTPDPMRVESEAATRPCGCRNQPTVPAEGDPLASAERPGFFGWKLLSQ
jgi:hypothetical protein